MKHRKAFASKGDDVTLTRFVPDHDAPPSDRKPSPARQLWFKNMRHEAMEKGQSIFHKKGVKPPHELKSILVSGHSNVKIGRDVRKGKLRGYHIYTLSLEERATCPRSCFHWESCYGNNMPFAKRVQHGPALEMRLEEQLDILCKQRRSSGILVRLHVLGDFYSAGYVAFWARMLRRHRNLAVFGYTARHGTRDPIDVELEWMKSTFGMRWAIRNSNAEASTMATQTVRSATEADKESIVCPQQTGKTICCATCALCWSTTKKIAFIEH